MWEFALNLITTSLASAFSWFGSILDSAPGAWDSIFTIFVIFAISRYLLAPILGLTLGGVGRSDKVKGDKGKKGKTNG